MTRSERYVRAVAGALLFCANLAHAQESALPRVSLVEEWRLDGAAADLSVTPTILVAPDGRFALPQPQDWRVLLFDAAGLRQRAIGRRGSGPGDFWALASNGGWTGDTVWVYDVGPRRVSYFDTAGRLIRSRGFASVQVGPGARSLPRERMHLRPLASRPDGSMLLWHTGHQTRDAPEQQAVVAMSARGELNRVLVRMPTDSGDLMVVGRNSTFFTSAPFRTRTKVAASPDAARVAFAVVVYTDPDSATIRIVALDAAGDTVAHTDLRVAGAPIPSRVVDSVIAASRVARPTVTVTAGGGSRPAPPVPREPELQLAIERALRERIPPVYHVMHSIQIGADHSLWLERTRDSTGFGYTVLDERLAPVFTVVLPPRSTLVHATATHVWTLQRDDDDLPSVVRYRLVR